MVRDFLDCGVAVVGQTGSKYRMLTLPFQILDPKSHNAGTRLSKVETSELHGRRFRSSRFPGVSPVFFV